MTVGAGATEGVGIGSGVDVAVGIGTGVAVGRTAGVGVEPFGVVDGLICGSEVAVGRAVGAAGAVVGAEPGAVVDVGSVSPGPSATNVAPTVGGDSAPTSELCGVQAIANATTIATASK